MKIPNISEEQILNAMTYDWQNYRDIDLTKNFFLGYGLGFRLNTIIGPVKYTIGKN